MKPPNKITKKETTKRQNIITIKQPNNQTKNQQTNQTSNQPNNQKTKQHNNQTIKQPHNYTTTSSYPLNNSFVSISPSPSRSSTKYNSVTCFFVNSIPISFNTPMNSFRCSLPSPEVSEKKEEEKSKNDGKSRIGKQKRQNTHYNIILSKQLQYPQHHNIPMSKTTTTTLLLLAYHVCQRTTENLPSFSSCSTSSW